jgi:hypothetical protein
MWLINSIHIYNIMLLTSHHIWSIIHSFCLKKNDVMEYVAKLSLTSFIKNINNIYRTI